MAPNELMGFYLSKPEFYDGIAVRYNANPINAPSRCEAGACGKEYNLEHALTCPYGGNRILRHDMVKRAVQSIAIAALGSGQSRVEVEPWLIRKGAIAPNGRVCHEGLKTDLLLTGLDPIITRTYLDIRVPYPDTLTARRKPLPQILKEHETEKILKYRAVCETLPYMQGSFQPFVVTTDGVLGPCAQRVLQQLVDHLCDKWKRKTRGEVMAWVRARLSVAVVRAASACIRGNRRKPVEAGTDVGFNDAAALGPLLYNSAPP